MPQFVNSKGADYEMPRPIISALVKGNTWGLWCKPCDREITVDVISLVERYEIYDRINFGRAKCKLCGGNLRQIGGFVLRSLQFRRRIPRLITSDGSDYRWPVFSAWYD